MRALLLASTYKPALGRLAHVRTVLVIGLALAGGLLSACSGDSTGPSTVAVTGVSLNTSTVSLAPGAFTTLVATVVPANATKKTVTWKTSNSAAATVDATGKVTGVAAGIATITVTTDDGNKTATTNVTVAVSAVAVTGVTLSNTAPNLEPGGTITLVPTVTPVGATNKAVTWASSNTAVATVDATGKVTAVAEGSAIITVTTVDGGKTATANVGVTLAPTISSFAPASAAFGETVTITGTNFGSLPGDNSVTFNNVPATVVSATATELQVTVPQNLLSGGPVRVAVAGKTGVSPSNFTYVRTWTVSTLAGGTQGSADGLKEAAQFEYPEGVEVDSEGNVYVADTDNSTIRKITPGGLVTTFAGSTGGFADGPRLDARFAVPRSLAIGEGGVIYVADWGNRRIRMITPDGVVTTLESDIDPVDIAVGPTGNLYIVDRENNRILVRSPDGQVAILAGGTQGSANGNGAAAQFNAPYGIALDAAGNAYVADTNNDLIRKITPDGDVTTLAGSIAGFRDGIGSEAQFDKPKGVAVDEAGNVFIGGGFNNSIRMITPDGVVSTIAGEAQFSFPYGVAFDSDGNLYVADRVNSAIRVLTPQ